MITQAVSSLSIFLANIPAAVSSVPIPQSPVSKKRVKAAVNGVVRCPGEGDATRVAVAGVDASGVATVVLVGGKVPPVLAWPPHAARNRHNPIMPHWCLRISFPPFTPVPLYQGSACTMKGGQCFA